MSKEEKMAGVDGIPITFTSYVAPGMQILVFGQNHDIVTEGDVAIAWKVWPSGNPMKVQFTYPYKTGVGAFYDQDGSKITIGPIVADPGTTWKFVTTSQTDPGELQLDRLKAPRPDGLYAILNEPPPSGSPWKGRVVNIGLYKDKDLFMIEPSVGVGNYAELTMYKKLYFGVLVNDSNSFVVPGKMFIPNIVSKAAGVAVLNLPVPANVITPQAQISQLTEVNLNKFPNGAVVTLKQDIVTQQLTFTAKAST